MAHVHSPTRSILAGFSLYLNKIASSHKPQRLPEYAMLCVLFLSMSAFAEVGVSLIGMVVDSAGMPVQGASVIADPSEMIAISDWSGSFELSGLTDGRYNLTVSHLGFALVHLGAIRVRKGEISRIRISMASAPILLPDAEIITYQHSNGLIANSEILISRKDWEASGARDLGDALRQAPGVTVLEGGGMTRITIRGSPSRTVEIDRDGIPLQDVSTGEADLSSIRLEDLDAIGIEPTGAGGKVHLISRELIPVESKGKIVSGSMEGYSTKGLRVDAAYGFDIWNSSLEFGLGGTSDQGDYQYTLDDGSRHDRINNGSESFSGHGRIGWQIGVVKVTGAVYLDQFDRGIPNLTYDPPTPDASLDSKRFTTRVGASLPSNNNHVDLFLYTQHYSGEYDNPEFQIHPETGQTLHFNPENTTQKGSRVGLTLNYFQRVWSTNARINLRLLQDEFIGKDITNNRVNVGVGYGSATRNTLEVESGLKFNKNLKNWSFALSPEVTLNSINDEGGSKYNNSLPSLYGSIERHFGWGTSLIGFRYGRSVIVPAFNALLIAESHYAVGNRNLKPERGESFGMNFEVSVDSKFVNSNFTVTSFQRKITDLIVWQRNSFAKYYPDNISATFARGMETTLSISLLNDELNAFANYIYNKSTIETPGDINRGNFTPLNPTHSGSASINFRPNRWGVVLGGRWVGRRYSTMSNFDPISTAGMGLPPYSLYDLELDYSLFYSVGKAIFTAGLDNILGSEYRIIERSPMPGRIIYLRATAEIN